MDLYPLAAIITSVGWAMDGKGAQWPIAAGLPWRVDSRWGATLLQALLLCMSGRVAELGITAAKVEALLEELLERELHMVRGCRLGEGAGGHAAACAADDELCPGGTLHAW